MQEGWKCTVCGKGNAPWADKCGHCADAKSLPVSPYERYRPAEWPKHWWEYQPTVSLGFGLGDDK